MLSPRRMQSDGPLELLQRRAQEGSNFPDIFRSTGLPNWTPFSSDHMKSGSILMTVSPFGISIVRTHLLALRVNHQRPPPGVEDNDAVIFRKVIRGQTINNPFSICTGSPSAAIKVGLSEHGIPGFCACTTRQPVSAEGNSKRSRTP